MGARLTYTVRTMGFGLGRIKTKLNCKHKLDTFPRESKIVTGACCISLAMHQWQDTAEVTVWCAEGCNEDFTWWSKTKMFILIFCNIKKPPWEPSRDLVI